MEIVRNRLSPHFLFNLLSGISAETSHSVQVKDNLKTLMRLLRSSVDNCEQTAIPLKEELELVEGYINLQKWRIAEPFAAIYEIKEGTNMNHPVPAMIIQIPVENAIKHGLMPLPGEKLLKIKIENYFGGLMIKIEDNGSGYSLSGNRITGEGTGLKTLFQTILLLNSANSSKIEFSIKDLKDATDPHEGTIVEIRIPNDYSYNFN